MSLKRRVLGVLFCIAVGFGSLVGLSMTPEEIGELMATMNRPSIAQTLPKERETGDDLLRKLLRDDVETQD